jgi:urease accessory protein
MKARHVVLVAALALAAPRAAEAHLVSSGMGPLYDGVIHFALSPEDGLPVVALGLYGGLRGPASARLMLAVLPLAWLVGGLLASATGGGAAPIVLAVASAAILLAVGGLLAANLPLPSSLCAVAAGTLGLVRGFADLAGAPITSGAVLTTLGMSAAVFAVFALAASVTLPLRRFWMIIAARVTGSWLAAAGLLLAGWIIRYGARV